MSSTFPISGLRSVELGVPDLEQAEAFYTRTWGLTVAAQSDGYLYLRCEGDDPYAMRLSRADEPAILSYTLRAADNVNLGQLRAQVQQAGGTPEGDIGDLSDYGGGTGFAMLDRVGRRLRIVQGDKRPTSDLTDRNRPDRLSHININTTDLERDIAFYVDGLGFAVSDRSKIMGFVRTNDDHHTIVLATAPVETLNHIAFNHRHWEDVMKASGRMIDEKHEMGWGPGRHGPGDNIFAYFVDPFGIVVEHTAEMLRIDDTYRVGGPADWTWPPGRIDQWGIAPPKTDACKAAQLAIPFK